MNIISWLKHLFSRGDPNVNHVRFYDFESKRVLMIPVAELKPGMIKARVDGVDGIVWVSSSQLKCSEIKHPPFPAEVRDLISHIQDTFKEHYNLTLDEWEDGFRRDRTPSRQIELWLHASNVYSEFSKGETSVLKRKEIYTCVLACMNTSRKEVWHVLRLTALTREEAERVINQYYRT